METFGKAGTLDHRKQEVYKQKQIGTTKKKMQHSDFVLQFTAINERNLVKNFDEKKIRLHVYFVRFWWSQGRYSVKRNGNQNRKIKLEQYKTKIFCFCVKEQWSWSPAFSKPN